jgi:hypothetical protein
MSYDLKGPYDGFIGHPSQLMPDKSDPAKLKNANQDSIINYWLAQGAQPNKLNMGISFQAKKFNLLNPTQSSPGSPVAQQNSFDNNAENLNSSSSSSELLSFSHVCQLKLNNKSWIKAAVDTDLQAPYMFGPNLSNGLTEWIAYSDTNTMRVNADYAKRKKLGGVTVWSLEFDDFSGKYCRKGRFPLLNKLNLALKNKPVNYSTTKRMISIKTSRSTTSTSSTTTTTKTTTTENTSATTSNIISNEFNISTRFGQCVCEEDFDYFRNDLDNKHSASNEDCCEFCLKNSECKSYTFISMTSSCWLKSSSKPMKIKASSRISCKPAMPVKSYVSKSPPKSVNNAFKQIEISYLGNDIEKLLVSNSEECSLTCQSTYNCNGWSYDSIKRICFIKSLMSNSTHDINFTSGFPSFDSFICRSGSFLMPNVLSSCRSFFTCSKDSLSKFKTKIINCPSNLLFNKLNNQCDLPENVQC